MSDTVEQFVHGDCTVRIVRDDMAECPLNEDYWHHGINFFLSHNNYLFTFAESFSDLMVEIEDEFEDTVTLEQVLEYVRVRYGAVSVLPVYMYSHGSDSVSTVPFGCHWDSGLLGIAWIDGAHGATDGEAYIRGAVDAWNSWMRGEVYGYIVTDSAGGEESCWGFVGDSGLDACREDARDTAGCLTRVREREDALVARCMRL